MRNTVLRGLMLRSPVLRTPLLRRALLMLLFTSASALAGCGDDVEDDVPPDATRFTLSPAGGTFLGEGPLAGVRLDVPPDAVSETFELWMAPPESSPPLPETGEMVGPEVEFGPGVVPLAAPAELTLPFEPAAAEQVGVARFNVKVWRVGPDGWQIDDPVEPPSADEVTVVINSLGHFGAGVEFEAQ